MWKEARIKILNIPAINYFAIRDRRALSLICNKAEKLGISSGFVEKASIENLRAIVKEARRAAMKSDKEELEKLLIKAAGDRPNQRTSMYLKNVF